MKLIACPACHLQYDVTHTDDPFVSCICGEEISTAAHGAIDAKILRCGSCGAVIPDDAEQCDYCESVIVRDPKKLSFVCPECYARNTETGHFCSSCGVRFQPQAFFGGDPPKLDCPVCEGELILQNVGGIVVRECDSCNGLWVPGDRFDELVRRMIEARQKQGPLLTSGMHKKTAFQSKIVYRKCPECQLGMHRKNFARKSGIIVDWCGNHGTWLDA
ncbi:zf-TFIIB domain-containing protein, partial [Candidatus Entotheonella palauensis]